MCFAISNAPLYRRFELNDGSWFTGGNSSDWAWGTPAKPVIRNAGSGSKCWITGGLTGNNYAGGEASWLQRPCFNFSQLQYPHISFDLFWETEKDLMAPICSTLSTRLVPRPTWELYLIQPNALMLIGSMQDLLITSLRYPQ